MLHKAGIARHFRVPCRMQERKNKDYTAYYNLSFGKALLIQN